MKIGHFHLLCDCNSSAIILNLFCKHVNSEDKREDCTKIYSQRIKSFFSSMSHHLKFISLTSSLYTLSTLDNIATTLPSIPGWAADQCLYSKMIWDFQRAFSFHGNLALSWVFWSFWHCEKVCHGISSVVTSQCSPRLYPLMTLMYLQVAFWFCHWVDCQRTNGMYSDMVHHFYWSFSANCSASVDNTQTVGAKLRQDEI